MLSVQCVCCDCLAAFEEPRRHKRLSKKQAGDCDDGGVSEAVVDETAEQDNAAAVGSTAWATKDKARDNDLSADRTVSAL